LTSPATHWKPGAPSFRDWVFRHRGLIPVPSVLLVILSSFVIPANVRDRWLDLLGLGLMNLGLVVRVWAIGYAGGSTRSYRLRAGRLVTAGPYNYVRNPIYLGNLLVGLGIVFVSGTWVALVVLAIVFSIEYGAIVSLEEEFLTRTFGDAYRQYVERVPRWLPRLRGVPAPVPAPTEFSWRAVRKEFLAVLSAYAMAGAVDLGARLPGLLS
jgi:protein-S-isoprenylcysteine O-methyltransferase Ste14